MAKISGVGVPKWLSIAYEVWISRWTSPRLSMMRVSILRRYFSAFGSRSTISFQTRILDPGKITVGQRSSIPNWSVLDGRGGIEIGDD